MTTAPRATRVIPQLCESPECKAVHLLLFRGEEFIAQATASREMVDIWRCMVDEAEAKARVVQ